MSRVRCAFAAAAVTFLVLPTTAAAQVTTADIVGRVTDSSGAVLPGAVVTIENLATHDVRSVPTNGTGDYVFNLLPIGTYTVKVELSGFSTQTATVNLSTGDRVRFDPKLQLGQIAENVLTVPSAAVKTKDGEKYVIVVAPDGRVYLPLSVATGNLKMEIIKDGIYLFADGKVVVVDHALDNNLRAWRMPSDTPISAGSPASNATFRHTALRSVRARAP